MSDTHSVIVSVSGVRGIVGRGLTPELATSFAAALGSWAGDGRFVISRDSRPSGRMLLHAVVAGFLSAGRDVIDCGILPTPTCGLAVRRLGAAGAIQITASHNPAEWNGLKLFGPEGSVLDATRGKAVQAIFEQNVARRATWNELGEVETCGEALDWHRQRVRELIAVERIRSRRFRALLDANGGAGGPLGRRLLESLNCDVTLRGCDPDGDFLHSPEPTAENLKVVAPLVARHQADIGFALDPDSDRLALIDETGCYIGEELTLALAVRYRLQQERGPVVVNMSTSRVTEDIAKQHDCAFHRSAVGEANVVELMAKVNAVIGGEGNGGVIDPRVGGVRDPFIGMGLVLGLMAESGKKLSELVAELPAYHIVKDKVPVDAGKLPELYAALEKRWPEATASRLDGLRLDWPDRWLHIRPSNTEPIVRVIAEAPTLDDARRLCAEAGAGLRGS